MSSTEVLLVLLVLILLYIYSPYFQETVDDAASRTKKMLGMKAVEAPAEPAPTAEPVAATATTPGVATPEQKATLENSEHFSACRSADEQMQRELSCMCDGQEDYSYAVNEFGAPGMEYKDWVAAQSVDPSVIKNHAEFVSDRARLREGNLLGSTWSPDMHMSYDPISWAGLRRPQAVAVCNPTQVPDVDYNLYSTQSTFSWKSGQGDLH